MSPSAPSGSKSLSLSRLQAAARVGEAMAFLVAAAGAQRWVPMPRWSTLLGKVGSPPDKWKGPSAEGVPERAGSPTERRVALAVGRASSALPFTPTCLAQATAGQLMLRLRGEPGTVVVGLIPPTPTRGMINPGVDVQPAWGAHAWLMGSVGSLAGGPAAAGFTATTVFRPARRLRPSPGLPR